MTAKSGWFSHDVEAMRYLPDGSNCVDVHLFWGFDEHEPSDVCGVDPIHLDGSMTVNPGEWVVRVGREGSDHEFIVLTAAVFDEWFGQ